MTALQRSIFEGVTVIDLGQVYNGPYCALLLAQMGAEVIKIEPIGGEPVRWRREGQETYPYLLLNAGKKGMCIDLKKSAGREIFLRLVEWSDVLIENFSLGAMERLGLAADELLTVNPRLVIASGKGFGRTGPNCRLPAMDLTVQAMTGLIACTGFEDGPPVKAGAAVADFMGGIHLMAGVAAALYDRERTGAGQIVEVSMQEALLPALTSNIAGYYESEGRLPQRTGNRHGGLAVAPYNVYEADDGWVAIFGVTGAHWKRIVGVMNRPDLLDDAELLTTPGRARRMDEVDAVVGSWASSRSVGEIVQLLGDADVPCAPVKTLADVVSDEHLRERGMLYELEHPTMGVVPAYGPPIRYSRSRTVGGTPSPLLGQHTREVLGERLSLSEAELDELERGGVIA